jgi:uncharacterized protein
MDEETFGELRARVVAGSLLRDSYHHGEQHWRAVAFAGLELLAATPQADPDTVLLFSLFHDARRENEWSDPNHGLRGADLALEFGFESRLLYIACRDHTDGMPTADPTIGVCFDADRLNLWRVGTTPLPQYLSTSSAPRLIERAQAFHDLAPDWADLVRRYDQLRPQS